MPYTRNRDFGRIKTYGRRVLAHRHLLELDQFEYAVISKCSIVDVISAENGHGRLPRSSESILIKEWRMAKSLPTDEVRKHGKGPGYRAGCPWQDIPVENHKSASDASREGGLLLDDIGKLMGMPKQRVFQLVDQSILEMRAGLGEDSIRDIGDYLDKSPMDHPLQQAQLWAEEVKW